MDIKKCSMDMLQDLKFICDETFIETFKEFNSQEDMNKYINEVYSIKNLKSEINDKNSKIYIAYDESYPVGYLKINLEESQSEKGFANSLEVQRIYILKKAKKLGLGSKFMKIAEDYSRENSLNYIWLGVWENNVDAINFYMKHGYIEFSKHIFKLGDDEQCDLLMKKDM